MEMRMSNTSTPSSLTATVIVGLRRHRRAFPGLQMTAMIDVIFLLLTFFVLTAQFKKPEQALPLVFGTEAASTLTQPPKSLELAILPRAEGCTVVLNGAETIFISQTTPAQGLAALAESVRTAVAPDQGRHMPIQLHCDDAVSWDMVTKIYDILYGLGARDITFMAHPAMSGTQG